MSRKVAGIRDVPCMHMKIARGSVYEYFSHLVSYISFTYTRDFHGISSRFFETALYTWIWSNRNIWYRYI